jgi:hypothetical protein
LARIGAALRDLAAMPEDDFGDAIVTHVLTARSHQLDVLDRLIQERSSPQWNETARRFRASCVASMRRPEFFWPHELVSQSTDVNYVAATRRLVGTLGRFLITWPDLWSEAKRLGADALLAS